VKHRLIILPQAKEDVRRNAEWWADHHSSEQVARWLDAVESQLETIVDFPMSHSLSAENDAFPYEIREKLVGLGSRPGDRAVFTIKDDTIYVLTVRRGAEDTVRPDQIHSPPTP
jgi:plasmid stabilization system protein ParE